MYRNATLSLVAALACIAFSSASSRPWNPTPSQIAGDYAQINHTKSSTDFVNIRWWASPTVVPGTPLAGILEKYIVVSVVHFHINQPGGRMSFDDTDTLEALDGGNKPLAIVPRNELPPAAIGNLSAFEASFRQSLGPLGAGMKFFTFDAGTVRACEKGGISIPFAGETYTWETPFPGCTTIRSRRPARSLRLRRSLRRRRPWSICVARSRPIRNCALTSYIASIPIAPRLASPRCACWSSPSTARSRSRTTPGSRTSGRAIRAPSATSAGRTALRSSTSRSRAIPAPTPSASTRSRPPAC
jgi:hypothetical protein